MLQVRPLTLSVRQNRPPRADVTTSVCEMRGWVPKRSTVSRPISAALRAIDLGGRDGGHEVVAGHAVGLAVLVAEECGHADRDERAEEQAEDGQGLDDPLAGAPFVEPQTPHVFTPPPELIRRSHRHGPTVT